MTDDCRLISRAGIAARPQRPANYAPAGTTRESIVSRNQIAEFLDATLIRPLYFSEEQQMQRVEDSLQSMTLAERVFIEIEMTERSKTMHSYDYDALR